MTEHLPPFDDLLASLDKFSAADFRQAADAVWTLAKVTGGADVRQLLLHVASGLHQEASKKELGESDDSEPSPDEQQAAIEPAHDGPIWKVGSRVMDKRSMEKGTVKKLAGPGAVMIEWDALQNEHWETWDVNDLVLLEEMNRE